MTLAVMQPYIFPYIGYYQLVSAVDKFVIYDDVSFIKQGWINRNRILLNQSDFLFTVPLKDASSNKRINETYLDDKRYELWKKKFLTTIAQAYKRAPQYKPVNERLVNIFESNHSTIASLATESIKNVCDYLDVQTAFIDSSQEYGNDNLKSQERVIDICLKETADTYLNATGGQSLYFREDFAAANVDLNFIKPILKQYEQQTKEFIPGLSIIDVLMYNSKETVKEMLHDYEIVHP